MHVLILRPYRKDNIYFRTIEEREKIKHCIYDTIYACYSFESLQKVLVTLRALSQRKSVNGIKAKKSTAKRPLRHAFFEVLSFVDIAL